MIRTLETQTENTNTEKKSISMPRLLLHVDGAAFLLTAIALYSQQNGNWWLFILLLLAPDLTFFAYMVNKRFGAMIYNIVHSPTLVAVIIGLSIALNWELGVSLGLILLAHIGMDRIFGYGYKYADEFKNMHFNRI